MRSDSGREWMARMLHGIAAFLLLQALCTSPRPLSAQSVQGQVLERHAGGPVEGALVLLLDSAGATRGGYLTGPAGRFLLRAPHPGRFSLRAERIGYETVTSDPFVLAGDETLNLRLAMAEAPIHLEEIRVQGEQRCRVRPEEGEDLARVWEEARKALAVQDWVTQQGAHRFRLSRWERELDPHGRVVLSESRRAEQRLSRSPTRTRPVEELLEVGFVQPDGAGGFHYHGPDAAVLLSDLFLDRYCFRLAEDEEDPGLIGLAFEPVTDREPPGIRGTLWLERESSRLQSLEYDYAWSPWAEAKGFAGGRLDFEELPGGLWIVRRWWIRMPVMEATPGLRAGSALRVAGLREEGAEVRDVSSLGLNTLQPAATGEIVGVVFDSIRSEPLAGATVLLTSVGQRAVTDPEGRFSLGGVPVGHRQLAFTHPLLDSLGIVLPEVEVSVGEGRTTSLDLFVPSRRGLLMAFCGEVEVGSAAIVGRVTAGGASLPASGATVRVEWTGYRGPTGAIDQMQADIHGLETVSDAAGRFRFCGVPAGWPVTVEAGTGDTRGASRGIRVPAGELMAVDLTLDRPRERMEEPEARDPGERAAFELARRLASAEDRAGGVRGRVVDAESGAALALADVELVGTGRRVLTREDGSFMIPSMEPGEVRLKVTLLGYGETEGVVQVAAGVMVEVEIRATTEVIALDPITVTALRRYAPLSELEQVQRRMESGWGQFIAREDIEARSAARVSELLVGSGVEVHANGDLIRMRRTRCEPLVYLDGQKLVGPPAEALRLVHPADLFAIEIYQGPGDTPGQYIDADSRCGVILLWTHKGGRE